VRGSLEVDPHVLLPALLPEVGLRVAERLLHHGGLHGDESGLQNGPAHEGEVPGSGQKDLVQADLIAYRWGPVSLHQDDIARGYFELLAAQMDHRKKASLLGLLHLAVDSLADALALLLLILGYGGYIHRFRRRLVLLPNSR